jgi:hypothetical protein
MSRALLLVTAIGCTAAPPPPPAGTAVPFELLANAIFVSARVNGHGPFLFALDTGSCCSVFASELVGELGMTPHGESHGVGAGAGSTTLSPHSSRRATARIPASHRSSARRSR